MVKNVCDRCKSVIRSMIYIWYASHRSIYLINQLIIIDGLSRSFTQFQYQFISTESSFGLALLCLLLFCFQSSDKLTEYMAVPLPLPLPLNLLSLLLHWSSPGVKCAINHSFSKSFLLLTSA